MTVGLASITNTADDLTTVEQAITTMVGAAGSRMTSRDVHMRDHRHVSGGRMRGLGVVLFF